MGHVPSTRRLLSMLPSLEERIGSVMRSIKLASEHLLFVDGLVHDFKDELRQAELEGNANLRQRLSRQLNSMKSVYNTQFIIIVRMANYLAELRLASGFRNSELWEPQLNLFLEMFGFRQ